MTDDCVISNDSEVSESEKSSIFAHLQHPLRRGEGLREQGYHFCNLTDKPAQHADMLGVRASAPADNIHAQVDQLPVFIFHGFRCFVIHQPIIHHFGNTGVGLGQQGFVG